MNGIYQKYFLCNIFHDGAVSQLLFEWQLLGFDVCVTLKFWGILGNVIKLFPIFGTSAPAVDHVSIQHPEIKIK